jgi:phosphate starvation-inducible PhoH-like protein
MPTCGRSKPALDVAIAHRGATFRVAGSPAQAKIAAEAVQRFYAQAEKPLSVDDISSADRAHDAARRQDRRRRRPAAAHAAGGSARPHAEPGDVSQAHPGARHHVRHRSGGTGKTYLAVACAVDALERDAVKRLVLVRPGGRGRESGWASAGGPAQKVDPYLRPLYDALYDLLGFDKTGKLFERGTIEIAPLAYMRGRTLNHSSSSWTRRRTPHPSR